MNLPLIARALTLLGLIVLSPTSWAESYVYLTNNTEQTLQLNISQTGSSLTKGDHWKQHATSVPPLGTVRYLQMNRDSGIKSGKTYYFDTTVTAPDGSEVVLKQKLTGTWNFSHIWQAAGDSGWRDDRSIYSINQSFANSDTTVAFKAQSARIGGDDIYYVLHPKSQYPTRGAANEFKVLAYNVWAILPGLVGKSVSERLNLIVNEVKGYDAIVFSELFDNSRRETFLAQLKSEYPYQTAVVDRSGALEDGGVVIVSRWPIETEAQTSYSDCDADDCMAAKGVMYAEINKTGQRYHLFGSHTQAWANRENQATRAQQFTQMRDFIDSRHIALDEPVLVAGDLNVDKEDYLDEYQAMLETLGATEVQRNGGYKYTADGSVNSWTTESAEILDYVLYLNNYKLPVTQAAKVVAPRSIHADVFTKYDLSDHFAVGADLTF